MHFSVKYFYFILHLVIRCHSYNILILNPFGSKSLFILSTSLAEAMADGGHEVIVVNSFSNVSSNEMIQNIHTGAYDRNILEEVNVFEMKSIFESFKWSQSVGHKIGNIMWTNPEIWSLWERRNEFDAIIIPGYVNEIAFPFFIDYKGTMITLCTPGIEPMHLSYLGNWAPFSVVPMMMLSSDENMNFIERAINPIMFYYTYQLYFLIIQPPMQALLEKYFPDIGPYERYYFQSSLMLINGHFALDSPVPLLPNQIEIGTINVKEPKVLPKDILEFILAADHGIVYFNLGSIVRSIDLTMEHKNILVSAFGKLNQRVLWKYEADDLVLPPNVMTRKWLPQQDILGHPKTLVFMSHCGNLGTQEAKYHGVPILALPVAFDQHRNAVRLVKKEFGLMLNWEDLTVEALVTSLQTLINETKYQDKLDTVSAILKDQKESPAKRALWWTEYVIRHKGAPHMEYAGKRLQYLQYVSFDVLVFWIVVFIILYQVLKKLLCKVFQRLIMNKPHSD